MTDTHQHDLLEYNKTNQIAMETLRQELMKKEEEEKERIQTVHQSQIGQYNSLVLVPKINLYISLIICLLLRF